MAERGDLSNTLETNSSELESIGAVSALLEAAQLASIMNVVATEGARHGVGLEAALFPGQGGRAWATEVAAIQSPERLIGMLEQSLSDHLADETLGQALDFYHTDLGARIAMREYSARQAMLDSEIEAGAMQTAATLVQTGTKRAEMVRELIETLDLVTSNVMGGLNANFAFYRGLGDGGAMRKSLTERDMLALVYDQEDDVRATTQRWLHGYLMLAYTPFSDDELQAYLDWAASPAGRKLSAALFAGFGEVFEATSYELGLAAARYMKMTDT
jgi:hypothetical protein